MESISQTIKAMPAPPSDAAQNFNSSLTISRQAAPISNGASNCSAWLDSEDYDARQIHREEHEQSCLEAIALRDATYGRERSEIEKRVEAQAMSLCLEDIPAGEIPALMQSVIKAHTNPYPPKAPDLLRRFKGEEWIVEDGKEERVVVANAMAYQPLQPTENELLYRAQMQALPAAERERIEEEGRRRWVEAGARLSADANRKIQKEISDTELLTMLHLQCDMVSRLDATPEIRKAMLEFGRWLLQVEPNTRTWFGSMAKTYWAQWQSAPKSEVAQ